MEWLPSKEVLDHGVDRSGADRAIRAGLHESVSARDAHHLHQASKPPEDNAKKPTNGTILVKYK